MIAVIFSLVLAVLAGGGLWLVLGDRFKLHEDERQNSLLNIAVLVCGIWPFLLAVVFFLLAPA